MLIVLFLLHALLLLRGIEKRNRIEWKKVKVEETLFLCVWKTLSPARCCFLCSLSRSLPLSLDENSRSLARPLFTKHPNCDR